MTNGGMPFTRPRVRLLEQAPQARLLDFEPEPGVRLLDFTGDSPNILMARPEPLGGFRNVPSRADIAHARMLMAGFGTRPQVEGIAGRPMRDGAAPHLPVTYGADQSGFGRGRSGAGLAPPAPEAGAPETEVALDGADWWLAQLAKGKAKEIFDRILNGSLSRKQFNAIYGQVTENLENDDLPKFAGLDPDSKAFTLTPEQMSIVQAQIDQLQPDALRQEVQAQFENAKKDGRIVSP